MSAQDIDSVTAKLAQASVEPESVLSFAKQGLKLDSADDAKKIIDALNSAKCVKTLILDGNTMGVDAARAIGQALEKHPEFQNALWSDIFTGRLKSEIPEALQYLGDGMITAGAGLVELDLSDNAFGPNGMKGLIKLLQSETCYSLQILRLHNNGLGTTGGKMLAECLLECHKRSVEAGRPLALKVFQSGRGRLENVGATALAEAFKAMGSLEEVVMPQNGIYHEGISALADAFTTNKNLKHLNLQDNTFTEKGAAAMAKALDYLENLEHIHFGDCLLRDGGAKVLSEALEGKHYKLKTLNLGFNEIGRDGGLSVASAMEGKENLETLEIDGNAFGEEGVELIQGTMETLGIIDQLGSLSEDEGEPSDAEPDDEGEEVNDPGLSVQGVAVTPRSDKTLSFADFLQFPSPAKLRQLGPGCGKALVQQLGSSIDDVEASIQSVMRTSSVVTADDNQTKGEACQCADAVLTKLFASDDGYRGSQVANEILVNLGLIKSENKKFKPLGNIQGGLIVLEHVVKQKYFPKTAKDILICFLGRPHPLLDACVEIKHTLMAALHH